jgi:hypothetical protein
MMAMLQQAGPLSLAGHSNGAGDSADNNLLAVAVDSMFDFGRQLATSTSGGELQSGFCYQFYDNIL